MTESAGETVWVVLDRGGPDGASTVEEWPKSEVARRIAEVQVRNPRVCATREQALSHLHARGLTRHICQTNAAGKISFDVAADGSLVVLVKQEGADAGE